MKTCPTCQGKRKVYSPYLKEYVTCDQCRGQGRIGVKCKYCAGTGKAYSTYLKKYMTCDNCHGKGFF